MPACLYLECWYFLTYACFQILLYYSLFSPFCIYFSFVIFPSIFCHEVCGREEQWSSVCLCTTSLRLSLSICRSKKQLSALGYLNWMPSPGCYQYLQSSQWLRVSSDNPKILFFLLSCSINSLLEIIKSSVTGQKVQLCKPSTFLLLD